MVENATSPREEEITKITELQQRILADELIDRLQKKKKKKEDQEETDDYLQFFRNLFEERETISSGRTLADGNRRMQIEKILEHVFGKHLSKVVDAWQTFQSKGILSG